MPAEISARDCGCSVLPANLHNLPLIQGLSLERFWLLSYVLHECSRRRDRSLMTTVRMIATAARGKLDERCIRDSLRALERKGCIQIERQSKTDFVITITGISDWCDWRWYKKSTSDARHTDVTTHQRFPQVAINFATTTSDARQTIPIDPRARSSDQLIMSKTEEEELRHVELEDELDRSGSPLDSVSRSTSERSESAPLSPPATQRLAPVIELVAAPAPASVEPPPEKPATSWPASAEPQLCGQPELPSPKLELPAGLDAPPPSTALMRVEPQQAPPVLYDRRQTRRRATDPHPEDVDVIAFYRTYHPRYRDPAPDSRERRNIAARRAEGYTTEELKQAIAGQHLSPYHLGCNDSGQKYLSLELALRSSANVSRFVEIAERGPVIPLTRKEREDEMFWARIAQQQQGNIIDVAG